MIEFDFWKSWSKPSRLVFFGLLFFLIFAWFFGSYCYYAGVENAYPWTVKSVIDETKANIEQFEFGFLTLPLDAKLFFLNEQLVKSLPDFETWPHYAFAASMLVCLALLMSSFSFLKSWWYFVGLVSLVMVFYGLRWDATLQPSYGLWLNYLLILLVAGIHVLVHLKRILPKFHQRFLLFLSLLFSVYALLFNLAINPSFVLMANYGILTPLGISLLFLVLTGFDPVYFFLYLNTSTRSVERGANFLNYFLISVLYLGNVFLAFFKQRGIYDLSIFVIPEWAMLGFVIFVGFFVHERRIRATGDAIDFAPFGAIQYLVFASITIFTWVYGYVSGSDLIVRTINMGVLYAQAFIGAAFFIYTIGKFGTYLRKDLKVYEIVFKAVRFPIHLVRIGGILAIIAMISYFGQRELGWFNGAYYAQVGFAYHSLGDLEMSREYLKESVYHSSSSYQPNFGIANVYLEERKPDLAIETFNRMLYLHNNQDIYANLSYCYDNPFGSIETLREGISKSKKKEVLMNNLGVVFCGTHLIDSSFYYFSQSLARGIKPEIFHTNLLHLLIKKNVKGEELDFVKKPSDYLPLEINRICYAKLHNEQIDIQAKTFDFKAVQEQLYFNNKLMFEMKPSLSEMSSIEKVINLDSTGLFTSDLSFAKSLLLLKQGKTNAALEELFKLQYEIPSKASLYLYTMGLICLNNHQYRLAAQYFDQSYEFKNQIAWVMRTFAETLIEIKPETMKDWRVFLNSTDSFERDLATAIISISEKKPAIQDPLFPYWLALFEDQLSVEEINRSLEQLTDLDQKSFATRLLLAKWTQSDNSFRISKLNVDPLLNAQPKIMLAVLGTLPKEESGKLAALYPSGPINDLLKINEMINSPNDTIGVTHAIDTLKNYFGFENHFIVLSIKHFNNTKQSQRAYDLTRDVVTANPFHLKALKEFCFIALQNGLEEYANDGKKKIEQIVKPSQFKEFNLEFERKKEEFNKIPGWE